MKLVAFKRLGSFSRDNFFYQECRVSYSYGGSQTQGYPRKAANTRKTNRLPIPWGCNLLFPPPTQ